MRTLRLTPHRRQVLVGLVALVLLVSVGQLALRHSGGYFDDTYDVVATFPTAGQNLDTDSDVKIRGVTVGRVGDIQLGDGGAAEVTLRLHDGVEVPTSATAVIRPVSIFGPKFVDLVFEPEALEADLLGEGDEVAATRSATELGDAVGSVYRLIDGIDTTELATVFDTFAEAGEGLAPELGRILTNGGQVVATLDGRAARLDQLLADAAALAETLAPRAPGIVSTAEDLHQALPVLIEGEAGLDATLRRATTLADDLTGLLRRNAAAIDAATVGGTDITAFTYERLASLIPAVLGLSATAAGFDQVSRPGVPGVEQLIFAQFNLPLNPCTGLGIAACGDGVITEEQPPPLFPGAPDLTQPEAIDPLLDPLLGLYQLLGGLLTPLAPTGTPPAVPTPTSTTLPLGLGLGG